MLALGAGRSGVALRRAHSCRNELQSLQVRLSPDPQIPRTRGLHCVDCRTVGERKRRLSVPTKTPSPAPRWQHFNPEAGRGSADPEVVSPFPAHPSAPLLFLPTVRGRSAQARARRTLTSGLFPPLPALLPEEKLVLYPSKGKRESTWGLQRACKGPNRSPNRKSSHNRHYDILTPSPSSTLCHLQPVSTEGSYSGHGEG